MKCIVFFVSLGILGALNHAKLTYVGCYKDRSSYRTLDGRYIYMNVNGIRYCSAICIEHGYRYAGTESASRCYCGNDIREKETNSNECDYTCKGNPREFCGGYYWISIYDTWPNPTGHLGCYYDYKHSRSLSGRSTHMSTNGAIYCSDYCIDEGYRYAGTEYGSKCYCGNTMRRHASSSRCNTPECAKVPCQNDGTCTDVDAQHYTCSCQDKWSGTHCEKEITTTTTTTSTTTTTTTTTTTMTTTMTSTTPTTTETTPTTITTTPTELPTTTELADITEITTDTNMTNSTSLYEKQADKEDQTLMTVYISVACAVVVMLVVAVVVLLIIYRRRKMKAGQADKIVLHKTETTDHTVKDGTDNISYMSVDIPSRRTTLYDNEHVIMTADGEHVNIEFHAAKSTHECNDYNVLSLSGNIATPGFDRTGKPRPKPNASENTYSHLNEHSIELTPSDTYSRVTTNRPNKISNLSDSTYSHVSPTATQSMTIESGFSPDGEYNTLNTLPKKMGRGKHISNLKAISFDNGDQLYGNISPTDNVKGVGLDDDNYAHVLDSELNQNETNKDIKTHTKTSSAEDNVYAKVAKIKNNTHGPKSIEADKNGAQYDISENVYDNSHGNYDYNDDHNYYNVCLKNQNV